MNSEVQFAMDRLSVKFNNFVVEPSAERDGYTLTYQPFKFDLGSDENMTFPGTNKSLLESIRESNRQIYNGIAAGLIITGKIENRLFFAKKSENLLTSHLII